MNNEVVLLGGCFWGSFGTESKKLTIRLLDLRQCTSLVSPYLFQYFDTQGSDNFVVRSGSVVRTGRSNFPSIPASFKPMARVSAYIMSLLVMASIVAGAAVSGHQGHLPHAARIPPFVRLLQTKLYFPLPLLRLRGGHDLETVVAHQLRTLGMWHHQTAFEREGIHARNLPDLTADDLAELVCVRVCMRRESERADALYFITLLCICACLYTHVWLRAAHHSHHCWACCMCTTHLTTLSLQTLDHHPCLHA